MPRPLSQHLTTCLVRFSLFIFYTVLTIILQLNRSITYLFLWQRTLAAMLQRTKSRWTPCRFFTTSTNPICNCGYQVSISETPSRFREWPIVSRIRSTTYTNIDFNYLLHHFHRPCLFQQLPVIYRYTSIGRDGRLLEWKRAPFVSVFFLFFVLYDTS